jgi:hypothetical protein
VTRSHDACAAPPARPRPRALVAVLRPLVAQIASSTRSTLTPTVDRHVAVPQRTLLCRDLLAEIGDDRAPFVSGDPLAAEGGAAPVTRESRK